MLWFDMKKKAKILLLLVRAFLGLIVVALIVGDLYCEVYGLPERLSKDVFDQLRARGIVCETSRFRAGVVRGIHCKEANIESRLGDWDARLHVEDLGLRVSWASAFTGDLQITSLNFTGGTLYLASSAGDEASNVLKISELSGALRAADDLSYRVEVSGNGYGARVSATGKIHGVSGLCASHRTTEKVVPNGDVSSPVADCVSKLTSLLQESIFSDQGARVTLEFETDIQRPASTKVTGKFEAAEVLVGRSTLRRVSGNFAYADGGVTLRHLAIMFSDDEIVRGQASYDFAAKTVSANLTGRAAPVTVSRLTNRVSTTQAEHWGLQKPLSISLAIASSPLTWEKLDAEATIEGEDLQIRSLPVSAVKLEAVYRHGMLSIPSFRMTFPGSGGRETLSGGFTWWPVEKAIAGKVEGSLTFPLRLTQLGVAVPSALRSFEVRGEPVAFKVALERSPLEWRKWRLSGALDARGIYAERWQAKRIHGDISLVSSVLSITNGRISFEDMPSEAISADVAIDFSQMESVDKIEVKGDIKAVVQARNEAGVEQVAKWEKGLDVSVAATIHPGLGTVSGNLQGTAFPLRAYRAFRGAFSLPDNWAFDHISEGVAPAKIILALPEMALGSSKWQASGTLSIPELVYNGVPVDDVTAEVEITDEATQFRSLHGKAQTGPEFSLDLALLYDPFAVDIREAVWHGDPREARMFIESSIGEQFYLRIWDHFTWADASPPEITLERLVYQRGSRKSDWSLTIDSHFAASNAKYRDLETKAISANVAVSLPGQVSINAIRVQTDAATAHGDMEIQTELPRLCEFRIRKLEGGCDPERVVQLINPEWDRFFESFEFSPDSTFTCEGSFFLGQDPRLDISGRIITPVCVFDKLRFEKVDMKWGVRDSVIYWDVGRSLLYGGNVYLTGTYDTRARSGSLACKVEKSNLWSLAKALQGEVEYEDIGAQLSGNCRLTFFRNWAARNLQLSGNGRVQIGGADLWRIPIFGGLGDLLNTSFLNKISKGWLSNLGSVTQLDALLDFKGAYVVVPKLETDGTVFSLSGDGEYSWETGNLRFNVTGETLKNIGLFNVALRPLSWVFNAEVKGTIKDHRWTMVNSLRKAISGGTEAFEGGDM